MARASSWRRTCPDSVRRTLDELQGATVYLLHQTGPTGFVVKAENNDKKCKIWSSYGRISDSARSDMLLHCLTVGSKFGAVLDMVTDRFATCLLLVMLSVLYPRYLLIFQVIIALDIVSHWMQMYSSLLRSQSSHKADPTFSIVMAIYYRRPVLFTFCAGNELFFAMLYLVYFTPGPTIPLLFTSIGLWHLLLVISLPVALAKNIINGIQLVEAAQAIVAQDVKEREKHADS